MQFHPKFPFGKGLWIWMLSSCMGGDLNKTIQQCKDFDISYVIVKCGDGENTWDQFTQEMVDAFHAAGIKIYSWSYVYGNDPLREAAIAMWALDMGVDGHVFDAESEYEGKSTQATEMLQAVRNHSASAFLAYAPFPIIDVHQSYPYLEFGKYCDAVMPQIYWGDFQMTPLDAMNWMYDNFSRWEKTWQDEGRGESVKPIIPLGQAYDNPEVTPAYKSTPEDITEFIAASRGYMSVNFWSFQHILGDPIWEALRDNNVKPPAVVATTPVVVVTDNPSQPETPVVLSTPDSQSTTPTIPSTTASTMPTATSWPYPGTDIPSSAKTTSTTDAIEVNQTVYSQKLHIDYFTEFIVTILKKLHLIQ